MAEERTLKEYAIPSTEEPRAIIVYPTVEGDNFEIKPALLNLVQRNQFSRSPTEDPNLHISTFLRLSVTHRANQEATRLHLFPFSLKDRVNTWFHSLEVGSITSWDQMRRAFLARFFPPSKIAQLRAKLYQFTQKDGESLYDAWERFKEMLRHCPHHGLEKWLTIHTFYNGLTCMTKITVDAAAGGALMNKDFTTAYALIKDMALNHYHWTDEKTLTVFLPSEKEAGMNEISSFDHLSAKVDALSQKFYNINISVVTPTSILSPCGACGILGHTSIDCKPGGVVENIEQLNFVQNNQGTSSNKTFYKNLQNLFGQKTTLPGYVNNQSVIQKSSLELFRKLFFKSNRTAPGARGSN